MEILLEILDSYGYTKSVTMEYDMVHILVAKLNRAIPIVNIEISSGSVELHFAYINNPVYIYYNDGYNVNIFSDDFNHVDQLTIWTPFTTKLDNVTIGTLALYVNVDSTFINSAKSIDKICILHDELSEGCKYFEGTIFHEFIKRGLPVITVNYMNLNQDHILGVTYKHFELYEYGKYPFWETDANLQVHILNANIDILRDMLIHPQVDAISVTIDFRNNSHYDEFIDLLSTYNKKVILAAALHISQYDSHTQCILKSYVDKLIKANNITWLRVINIPCTDISIIKDNTALTYCDIKCSKADKIVIVHRLMANTTPQIKSARNV